MSRKSFFGCADPLYHAQESSLLLMQAKCLAWFPLTLFSITQSVQRHSAGPLIVQGMDVQRVILKKKKYNFFVFVYSILPHNLLEISYLAVTAHFIALNKAFLLRSTQALPGFNEVAQSDMHCSISLQFTFK